MCIRDSNSSRAENLQAANDHLEEEEKINQKGKQYFFSAVLAFKKEQEGLNSITVLNTSSTFSFITRQTLNDLGRKEKTLALCKLTKVRIRGLSGENPKPYREIA